MKKIADWIVDHEKDAAADCTVPDETIDEWLDTIEERKKRMEEYDKTNTAQYEMLMDLDKKVKEIKKIRAKKCHIDTQKS
jgi:thiamine kinase-like enzyme